MHTITLNIKEEHFVLKNVKLCVYILLDLFLIKRTDTPTDFRPCASAEERLWLDKICTGLSWCFKFSADIHPERLVLIHFFFSFINSFYFCLCHRELVAALPTLETCTHIHITHSVPRRVYSLQIKQKWN